MDIWNARGFLIVNFQKGAELLHFQKGAELLPKNNK